MSAFIAEVKSWQDIGGIPVVNGSIFIGVAGADPKISPITVFSDRDLTVVLGQPVLTDSFGNPVNKIWIPGRYSIKVEDSLGNQVFQELDNGEEVGTQTLSLTNVLGINAITGDASPTITALTDKAQFVFQVVSENTADVVTLDIDSTGAKAIKRNYTLDVGKAKFQVDQTVIVVYNSTNDNFEWTNNNQSVILDNQVSVASAATVDLALSDGNSVLVTGHDGPITSFGTVLAGAIFDLTFPASSPVTITSSSVANPTNILCAAVHGLTTGDEVIIAGHSGSVPDINGRHTVTVIDTTNYTVPVNVTTGGTGGTSTGVPKITHNATSMILPGGKDIDLEPDDTLRAQSLGSSNWRGVNFTSALSLSQIATQDEAETGTEDTKIMSPLRVQQSIDDTLGTKFDALTFELLATETASASSSLDFDSGVAANVDFSTFTTIVFELIYILPATDDQELLIRTSTDGGTTYDAGATDYHHASTAVGHSTGAGSVEGAVTSSIFIDGVNSTATNKWSNAAGESLSGTVKLRDPSDTTNIKSFVFIITGITASGETAIRSGGGDRSATADIDGVRFLFASGNIASGTIKCFGIK